MKSIFNSLGSNYSFNFVLLALSRIFFVDNRSIENLQKYLNKKYQGKSFLFYKGRDAIEFSLRILLEPKSNFEQKVLTQAFSCFAVEEGIRRAGITPVYVDIQENSTNMSVETLNKALSKTTGVKAVLVQHSLGIPADILAIKKWCNKNNLLLIEDLAQTIGGVDKSDQSLGKNADAVIFSFGRDKIVDAVSGGAVVLRNLTVEQLKRTQIIEVGNVSKLTLFKDMLYPLVTFLGRKTYDIFVGKVILKLAFVFRLITSPTISPTIKLTKMHSAHAKLALTSLLQLDKQMISRRKIVNHYLSKINNKNIKIINTKNDVKRGSNLRFSIRVKNTSELITVLRDNKIYLSDRWYRKAVDCGKHLCNSQYVVGLTKNAEKMASEILNLPTHQNISLQKSDRIIEIINNF